MTNHKVIMINDGVLSLAIHFIKENMSELCENF